MNECPFHVARSRLRNTPERSRCTESGSPWARVEEQFDPRRRTAGTSDPPPATPWTPRGRTRGDSCTPWASPRRTTPRRAPERIRPLPVSRRSSPCQGPSVALARQRAESASNLPNAASPNDAVARPHRSSAHPQKSKSSRRSSPGSPPTRSTRRLPSAPGAPSARGARRRLTEVRLAEPRTLVRVERALLGGVTELERRIVVAAVLEVHDPEL